MALGGAPKSPAAVPLQAAAKTPDSGATATATQDELRRKMGLQATILTGPTGLAAPTTAKPTLGA